LGGLGKGLGEYIGNMPMRKDLQALQNYQRNIQEYQQGLGLAQQAAQARGTDIMPGWEGAQPQMPTMRSPQLAQMQAAGILGSQTPMTPFQKAQLGIQSMGAQAELHRAMKAGWEVKQVGDRLVSVNPATNQLNDLGEATPSALEQAQTGKLMAETAQIGQPKVMSKEELKNLQADTELKLKLAEKAATEAGYDKVMKNRTLSNTLRDDFNILSKDFRIINDSYNRILALSTDPSAAGDIGIIFSYMKILDPTSVIRESEFATAANAASVPDSIRNMYNKALTGERISWNRDDFIKQAYNMYKAKEANQKQIINKYTNIANRWGMNPQDVITDIQGPKTFSGEIRNMSDEELKRIAGIE
jgi:hypothetical protein